MGICGSSEIYTDKQIMEKWELFRSQKMDILWDEIYNDLDGKPAGNLTTLFAKLMYKMLNSFEETHREHLGASFWFGKDLNIEIQWYLEQKLNTICPDDELMANFGQIFRDERLGYNLKNKFRLFVNGGLQSEMSYRIAQKWEKTINKFLLEKYMYGEIKTKIITMEPPKSLYIPYYPNEVKWIEVCVRKTDRTCYRPITIDQILLDLQL